MRLPVSDQDEAGKIQVIHVLFLGRTQGKMIQSVSRERFYRNGDAIIIHEETHLDDRKFAFFFTDAHFSEPFFKHISLGIQDIIIGIFNLKIEVCHIIIDDLWGAVGFFNKICI